MAAFMALSLPQDSETAPQRQGRRATAAVRSANDESQSGADAEGGVGY